jgi:hypothetical protein
VANSTRSYSEKKITFKNEIGRGMNPVPFAQRRKV